MGDVAVTTFPTTKMLLLREYQNDYYPLLPFFLATYTTAILLNVSKGAV